MTAVVGRVWGWMFSSGGRKAPHAPAKVKEQTGGSCGTARGWTSWIWGGWRRRSEESGPEEEFWEASEKIQPVEFEGVRARGPEGGAEAQHAPAWWNKYLPTYYLPWPGKKQPPRRRKCDTADGDGDLSDYGTPPPSPTPPSPLTSPFRLFADSWNVEVLPDHYEICFNFLRHLFDLFVVGFLWTVSPPAKVILEVLGIQGPLRLWFHGMAMFFVSTVGMAGLLWLVQEYLAQFALIYGVVQAVVISVSVKQSVLLSVGEEEGPERDQQEEGEVATETKVTPVSAKDKTS